MLNVDLKAFIQRRLQSISNFLSSAYFAGPELSDALRTYDRFVGQDIRGTIGYFNQPGQLAREIADTDLAILAALAERGHGYLSIKAPPMGYDATLIDEIALQAHKRRVGIHFDAHAIETTDPTFAAIDTALRRTAQVGCTLPGRWPRSVADVEWAVDRKLRVRVVKGQWADPAHPDHDAEAGYLDVIRQLAGKATAVAVATHDPKLARRAITQLQERGTPCELELLFGLPMRAVSAVGRDLQVPIRIYIPFGAAWMPYALSQLYRKPSLLTWVIKDLVAVSLPGLRR